MVERGIVVFWKIIIIKPGFQDATVDEEEDLGEEEGEDNRNIKSIGVFNSTKIFC